MVSRKLLAISEHAGHWSDAHKRFVIRDERQSACIRSWGRSAIADGTIYPAVVLW
jgi:hypothetical protein